MFQTFSEYESHLESNCTEFCDGCEMKYDSDYFRGELGLCKNCAKKCDGCGEYVPKTEIHHGVFDSVLQVNLDLCHECFNSPDSDYINTLSFQEK